MFTVFTKDVERVLTVQEVSENLRVSQPTVKRLIYDGKLKAIKVGRQWRIPEEELQRFIQENTNK